MSSRSTTPPHPLQRAPTRHLNEILGALVGEFAKASAGRDLEEASWREIYKDHSALAGFEPSRVRVVGATVSLPVAIDRIGEAAHRDIGLSVAQLDSVLGRRFPAAQRREAATSIRQQLVRRGKNCWTNPALAGDIAALATDALPGFVADRDLDVAALAALEAEERSLPLQAREASFLYRAMDLEKLRPELILRMDLTLVID